VTVERSDFEITSLEPGDVTVEQGETVDVTVTVENVGGIKGSTPLELRLDGAVVAEGEVPTTTLGAQETLNFTDLETTQLEPGEYTYGAYIDGTEQTATITIDAVDDGDTGDGTDGDGTDGDGTDGDGTDGDGTDGDGTDGDGTDDDGTDGDGTDGDGTDGDDSTDDGTPGFSVIVTLLALLLATGLLTRRE
jgi:PGF-CTERM protein